MRKIFVRIIIIFIMFLVYFIGIKIINKIIVQQPETIEIKYSPLEKENIEAVYLLGDFNDWIIQDSNKMTLIENNVYYQQIPFEYGKYYYCYAVFYENANDYQYKNNLDNDIFDIENKVGLTYINNWNMEAIKKVFSYTVIGLIILFILYVLIQLCIEKVLSLQMTLSGKLTLSVLTLTLMFGIVIITYNIIQIKSEIKNDVIHLIETEIINNENNDISSFDLGRCLKDNVRQIYIIDSNDNVIYYYFNNKTKVLNTAEFLSSGLINRNIFIEDKFKNEIGRFNQRRFEKMKKNYDAPLFNLTPKNISVIYPILKNESFNGYYFVILSNNELTGGLKDKLFINILILVISLIIMFQLVYGIGNNFSRHLNKLIDWTKNIIRGNFDIDVSIPTNDEFGVLSENFHQMRVNLGENVQYLKLVNSVTEALQRITNIEELYYVFLSCLTANFGMGYNRAAIFLKENDNLVGKYAVGMQDDKEMNRRFGSYLDYAALNIDLDDFIVNYKDYISKIKGIFVDNVKSITIDMFSSSNLWDVLNREAVLYISDENQYFNPMDKQLKETLNLKESLFMPIFKGSEAIGIIMVDNYFHKRPITQKNIDQLKIIVNNFAVNLENAYFIQNLENLVEERTQELNNALDILKSRERIIKTDLAISRRIQEGLLPKNIDKITDLNFDIKYFPMSEVGGDFYDIVELRKGYYRVFLADATGHGVQAALITMLIKSEYEKLKTLFINPGKLLEVFNNNYIENYDYLSFFFTCVLMDFDMNTMTVKYASGGHPNQMWFHKDGITEILPTGKIMGIVPDASFKVEMIELSKEDRILLFTDGMFEQFNSEMIEFNDRRLLEAAQKYYKLPVHEVADLLLKIVKDYMGDTPVNDDITVLGIGINDSPAD